MIFLRYIQPTLGSNNDQVNTNFISLFSDVKVLVVTGAVWVSTTAMALLEPCLPIWLMDTIKPEKWQLGIVFLPDSIGYLIGTNFFAVPALKLGRHKVALVALIMVSIGCFTVIFERFFKHFNFKIF